jgi:tetratricopeptide (TPR) repeat protein
MYNDDEEDSYYEGNFNEELARFENSLKGEPLGFMDSDTLEALIDHYLIQGNYTKASMCADLGMEQFPFILMFQLRKAQAISANGQLKEALTILTHLEKMGETSCEHFLTKAAIFSQLRDSKTAVKYFQEALNVSEPEDKDEIYIDLAMEYESLRDFTSAIKILQQALINNPDNEVAIYELAYCYDQLADYDKAIECYSNFIDENPYSFTAWYNLGNAYSKQDNFEKAIWAYDYCVLINEEFSPAYFNLGNAYLSLDKYKTSIEQFEKCIEIDGEDGLTLCYIGECYEQLGDLELAKSYYRKSLELIPDLSDAWLGLGIIQDLEGDIKGAIKFIEKAIELEPTNASYYHVLAGAFEKTEDIEGTQKWYLKALELDQKNDEIVIDYVGFLLANDFVLDLKLFFDSFETSDLEVLFTMELLKANYYFKIGQHELAIIFLRQCIIEDLEAAKEIFSIYPYLLNESKIVTLFPN